MGYLYLSSVYLVIKHLTYVLPVGKPEKGAKFRKRISQREKKTCFVVAKLKLFLQKLKFRN